MTLGEALETIDSLKHNIYSRSQKIAWLSRLDAMVQQEIFDTCRGEQPPFSGYDADTDPATALLVQPPYDEMYLRYLEAQMDYANGEYHRYNNAIAMFRGVYDSFANAWRRAHLPHGQKFRYF